MNEECKNCKYTRFFQRLYLNIEYLNEISKMKIYLIKKYEKPKDFLYPNKGMKDLLPSHMLL